MFRSRRAGQIRKWTLFFILLGVISGGLAYFYPLPPTRVTMATAFKGTGFHYYGLRYRDVFARHDVTLDLKETAGAVDNLKLLQDPAAGVQIAFVLGGVSDGDRSAGLLSLGTVYNVAFWIFYCLPEPIDHLSQLRTKRIAVGPVGSGIRATGEKVLRAGGVTEQNATFSPLGGQAAIEALEDGKVDAIWTTAPPELPAIQNILRIPNVRLLHFKNAEGFSRTFGDLARLDLPQGVLDLAANFPPTDVSLLATKVHALVRSDLHPAMLNVLLQTIVKVHAGPGVFQRAGDFPTSVDPEYPMAQAAVDFYKNGPSFLHRHLPLWLTVHVQRVIILAATVLPLLFLVITGEPQLYRWIIRERMRSSYRRLRNVEGALRTAVQANEINKLMEEVEKIDRATSSLRIPGRYADALFSLKVHINMVRSRVAARLIDLKPVAKATE